MDSNMSPAPFQLFRPLPPAIESALRASIERFGVLVPVVRDQHGNVLDGHQRVRIADELGVKYPVNIIEVADEAEALEIARTLNEDRREMPREQRLEVEIALRKEGHSLRAIAGVVGVTQTQVARDLSGVTPVTPDVSRGLDGKSYPARKEPKPPPEDAIRYAKEAKRELRQERIAEREQQRTEALATIAKAQQRSNEAAEKDVCVKPGEWWQLGRHRLYCGDTSSEEFISECPKAAFAFADPPYGAQAAEWDNEFVWAHDYLSSLAEVTAVTPGIISIFDFARITKMPYAWSVACWIDNGKTRGALGFGNWIYVALFSASSLYRNAQDFVRVSISGAETRETTHKGRKPSGLIVWLLQTFTNDGDVVIDPFAGSGTTLLVAESMGRTCVTGEIDHDFCTAIILRWQKATGQVAHRAD